MCLDTSIDVSSEWQVRSLLFKSSHLQMHLERREERGERREERGDRRQETGDRRQETGDRRQERGEGRGSVIWREGVTWRRDPVCSQ